MVFQITRQQSSDYLLIINLKARSSVALLRCSSVGSVPVPSWTALRASLSCAHCTANQNSVMFQLFLNYNRSINPFSFCGLYFFNNLFSPRFKPSSCNHVRFLFFFLSGRDNLKSGHLSGIYGAVLSFRILLRCQKIALNFESVNESTVWYHANNGILEIFM